MTDPTTQILRNASRRPVELHLADRVEVMPPGATIELESALLSGAGISPLMNDGVLTRQEPPPPRKPRKKSATQKAAKRAGAAPSNKPAPIKPKGAASAPVVKPAAKPAPGKHATSSGERK